MKKKKTSKINNEETLREQRKRLNDLVADLRQVLGKTARAIWECGKKISDEAEIFSQEETERKGTEEKTRELYGTQRIRQIALKLGVVEKTVRRWQYFYLMTDKQWTNYDERLSPSHYYNFYTYRDAEDNELRIPTQKRYELLKEAANDKPRPWSWKELQLEINNYLQSTRPNKKCPYIPLEEQQALLKESIKGARNHLEAIDEWLRNPERDTTLVEDVSDLFYLSLLIQNNLMLMAEQRGRNVFRKSQISSSISKIKPFIEMPHATYVGSKRKQLYQILVEAATHVPWDRIKTVCDLFGGRMHVAHALKQQNLEVTANDKLKWLYYFGKWVVEGNEPPLTSDDLRLLLQTKGRKAKVPRWLRIPFYDDHDGTHEKISQDNLKLSGTYLSNLSKLPPNKQPYARCLLSCTLFDHMPFNTESHGKPDRLEYDLQFALKKNLHEFNQYVVTSDKPCRVTNDDAIEHLKHNKYDLLYLDPPYAAVKVEIYSSSLPESIVLGKHVGDNYFDKRWMNNKQAPVALEELFKVADKAARFWIVSYNSTSFDPDTGKGVTPNQLAKMISKYRRSIQIASPHSMNISTNIQAAALTRMTDEVLLVCAPYDKDFKDARIVSKVRAEPGEITGHGLWILPGAFADVKKTPKKIEVGLRVFQKDGKTYRQATIKTDLGDACFTKGANLLHAIIPPEKPDKISLTTETETEEENWAIIFEEKRNDYLKNENVLFKDLTANNAKERYSALVFLEGSAKHTGNIEKYKDNEKILNALETILANPIDEYPRLVRYSDTWVDTSFHHHHDNCMCARVLQACNNKKAYQLMEKFKTKFYRNEKKELHYNEKFKWSKEATG